MTQNAKSPLLHVLYLLVSHADDIYDFIFPAKY